MSRVFIMSIVLFFCTVRIAFSQDMVCRTDTVNIYQYIPDTEVKYLISRILYQYTADNKVAQRTNQTYNDATGVFTSTTRYNYTYNNEGKLTEEVSLSWNSSLSAWKPTGRITYSFSNVAPQEVVLEQDWDNINNVWENYSRRSATLNAEGYQIENVMEQWDNFFNTWYFSQKYSYQFDAVGNTTYQLRETWSYANNNWQNFWQRSSVYAQGTDILIEYTDQNWNTASSTWVNSQKANYTLNASNQYTESLFQIWNTNLSLWQNNIRVVNTYFTNPSTTQSLRLAWNNAQSIWENNSRSTYTYDNNDNQTSIFEEDWNETSSAWLNVFYLFREYNENNILLFEDFRNQWNQTLGYYGNRTRQEYRCNLIEVVSISENEETGEMQLFPNPVNEGEWFTVNSPLAQHYTLTDFTGKQIKAGLLTEGYNTINTMGLPGGMYIFRTPKFNKKVIIH